VSETSAAHGHEPGEQYDGPARVEGVAVQVRLRGHFQPIDGRFHWWGRIGADPTLDADSSGATVSLETPHGSADGRLSDIDPWGRFRVTGTGTPPF
jgi:hypothetical protein